ncbi:hypothetical protein ABE073_04010 [Lederbergia citrisecunda]
MKRIKAKLDEIVIKVYVKYTVMMWEVEDMMNELMDDLKKIVKMSK